MVTVVNWTSALCCIARQYDVAVAQSLPLSLLSCLVDVLSVNLLSTVTPVVLLGALLPLLEASS